MSGISNAGPTSKPVKVRTDDGQDADSKFSSTSFESVDFTAVQTTGTFASQIDSNWDYAFEEVINPANQGQQSRYTAQQVAGYNQTPGSYTQMLNGYLVNGGSPQLQAFIQYRHNMNVQAVEEMNSEGGGKMSEVDKMKELAKLDDAVSLEVLAGMCRFEKQQGGTIGGTQQTQVKYHGIDILRDVEFGGKLSTADFKNILNPANVANMTNDECTGAVNKILGPSGGGAAMSAQRTALLNDPAGLAEFDRGLLITMGTTFTAAAADSAWGKTVGIDAASAATAAQDGSDSTEIPPEFRRDLLSMLAYVFAKMDQSLHKKLVDDINQYTTDNNTFGDSGKNGDSPDAAMGNSLNTEQLMMKSDMEAWSNNVAMGSSLISQVGDALKSIWH